MSDTNTGFILTGIDASERGMAVIDYAIWASKKSQLPLYFLHTIEHSHQTEQAHHEGNLTPNIRRNLLNELSDEEHQLSKKLIAEGKELLEQASTKAEQAGLKAFQAKQRHGSLTEALKDLETDSRMVVIGSKGEDHGSDKGLGSQLEEAIRAIQTPIFIVKNCFTEPNKIMFAYNGSPTSKKVLQMLKNSSIYNKDLELHVVSVQKEISDAEQLIADAKTILSDSTALVFKALCGDPLSELIAYQKQNQIDITAMGAFSHGKMHGFFFGSFTTKMLLQSTTNFILIRQD